MSLYDDDEDDFVGAVIVKEKQNDNVVNSWNNTQNSSFKLLEAQLQAKKYQQQSNNANNILKREKQSSSMAPVIDLSTDKRKQKINEIIITNPVHSKIEQPLDTESNLIKNDQTQSIYSVTDEEYDPLKPNDYEKLVEDLKKRKLYEPPNTVEPKDTKTSLDEPKIQKQQQLTQKDNNRGNYKGTKDAIKSDSLLFKPRYDEYDDYEKDFSASKRTNAGAAFAPPPSLIEENKKSDSEEYESPFQNTQKNTSSPAPVARSAAEKMMEKMGYKEGEGLGRNKQGMSVALQVEKTGKRSGRIIHEKDVTAAPPTKDITPQPAEVMKNQSKVILLRNMVGPGEVDGELEGETKEECQKYGEVQKVVIFEIPNTTPEESVRIFIEFKTLPGAIKALVDLNGRYFGGRIVKANFYNFDKFRSYNLADEQ